MATLCARPTDCLAGRAFFGAHRGVRATPAPVPASRRPMQRKQQQEESRIPGTASQPVAARGRANGRQRRRGSPPAAGAGSPPPPRKRVMENVVILKRGQPIPVVVAAALPAVGQSVAQAEKDEAAMAADPRGALADAKQSSSEAAKVIETVTAAVEHGELTKEKDKPVAFAGRSGAPAASASAEPASTAGKHGPGVRAKKAGAAKHGAAGAAAKAEPVAAPAHQTVLPRPQAKETEQAPVATAGAATKAKQALPAAYAGPSFAAAAPDPSELPIPVLLLKNRRAARTIRAPVTNNDHAPVPMAAAAYYELPYVMSSSKL